MKKNIFVLMMVLALILASCATTESEVLPAEPEAVAAEETAIEEAVVEEETAAEEESSPDVYVLTTGSYQLKKAEQDYLTADCYELQGVRYTSKVTVPELQYLNIWIPSGYVNEDGSIDWEAEVNGYTPATAPIVFRNIFAGWRSSDPESRENSIKLNELMEAGYIYVSCGGRSRDAVGDGISYGKAPTPVVDLKSGVRFLRANNDVLPGDTDKIISIGGSGAGQMSAALGVTGNMPEYYPYLYENGAEGIELVDGEYVSTIDDNILASQCYFPITDLDNADLAYAWQRMNSGETMVPGNFMNPVDIYLTDFQLVLQQDEAEAYVGYLNSLGLGLELEGTRSGSYYDAILNNLSSALNAYVAELSMAEEDAYISLLMATNTPELTWLVRDSSGLYRITSLDGFIRNSGSQGDPDTIGTAFVRNKDIPGFDTFDLTAENDAFGPADVSAVHYSATVGKVLADNYEKYLPLMNEAEKEAVDLWISQTQEGELAEFLISQTYLVNPMEILLAKARGEQETVPAVHWRIRSGTADEHTAFTIGYNLALALEANGIDTNYHLVWAMTHNEMQEGTSTGTFLKWTESFCR